MNKLDLLKPKEDPVQESAANVNKAVTVDWEKFNAEADADELVEIVSEPVVSAPTQAYHIPAKYKDLGDLTQEEWQEVFGRNK